MSPLLTLSDDALAEAFEAGILTALGSPDPALHAWARSYRELSAALTEDRTENLARRSSAALHDLGGTAVAGLVYAARTLQIGRRLFTMFPPPPGRFVELGAGWGPLGVLAAAAGSEVELWDVERSPLEKAPALHAALGLAMPRIVQSDIGGWRGPASAAAVPFALNELLSRIPERARVARGAALVGRWLEAIEPGGLLYVLEPGLKETARVLQAIRDELVASGLRVEGPCTRAGACPLLPSERDWCHFTWSVHLGPLGRAVAQLAGRQHHQVHFSVLVLRKGARAAAEDGSVRVLEIRPRGAGRLELTVCGPAGTERLVALTRDAALSEKLSRLSPGSRLRLDRDRLTPKGDGLRLEGAEALEILAEPTG